MKKLEKIKVTPVAFESLGVRSMCTYVETPDIKILLDAGVSLCPNRYGLPPHPTEYRALRERRNLMLEIAEKADAVTVSHYHFDHHTPSYTDYVCNWSSAETAERIYKAKTILAKNYKSQINPSQRRRGWLFAKTGGKHAARIEYADSRTFRFGATTVRFSAPVFHGSEDSRLGWVLMVVIERGFEKVLFAPDVQGPMYEETLRMILGEEPQLAIVGGPPVYLVDFKVSPERIDSAMKNLETIAEQVPVTILDHHILRDENWRQVAQPVFDKASSAGHRVITAAEYAGAKNRMLEAQRKSLFENEMPSQEFTKWTKIPVQKRKTIPPPI
ncbi:MAG: hypothetical protein NWF14_07325 [Candidatus Bathyarchaeota archaeon]|nr:hypothetical protein [Candidatus Bathyarchaeota archaeon]